MPETIPVVGMDEAASALGGGGKANLFICVLTIHSYMNGKK